jgi:hypothetical protein
MLLTLATEPGCSLGLPSQTVINRVLASASATRDHKSGQVLMQHHGGDEDSEKRD